MLEKAKNRFYCESGTEKSTKYYEDNQEDLREKAKNQYRLLSEQDKKVKKALQKIKNSFFCIIENKWKNLDFGNDAINKRKLHKHKHTFHKCKQLINVNKVDIGWIVISNKDSYGNKDSFEYFIGYKSDIGVLPLCIKHLQLNRYAKYFDIDNESTKFLVHSKKAIKTIQCNVG